jgi:lysozyme
MYGRATIGLSKDVMFERHVFGAGEQQIPQGGYHFLMMKPSISEQMKLFADRVFDLPLPPMLDVEQNGDMNVDAVLHQVRSAIAHCIEYLGVKPILYTYPAFWRALGKDAEAPEFADLELWIANYTTGAPSVPAPWKSWRLHQWAASDPHGPLGLVDGVTGYVDRNYFNGTREDFAAWWQGTGTAAAIVGEGASLK